MTTEHDLPDIDALKDRARALRAEAAGKGETLSHAQALEALAHGLGYRDWNTLSAAARGVPRCPVSVGDRVAGRYLGQPFRGSVLNVTADGGARFRVTLHFDEPVDVVRFASFSSMRQRVSCRIDASGRSAERTSDGEPQMVLERVTP